MQRFPPLGNWRLLCKLRAIKGLCSLQHPGRQASIGYAQSHQAYAPTALDFPFLDYPVQELTNSQIEQIIQAFGQATARTIAAGFSGVEIHGANHYLLQQFFPNILTDAQMPGVAV